MPKPKVLVGKLIKAGHLRRYIREIDHEVESGQAANRITVGTTAPSKSRCDTPNPGIPLTTRKPVEFLWISGDPIPVLSHLSGSIFFKKSSRVSFVLGALPNIQPV